MQASMSVKVEESEATSLTTAAGVVEAAVEAVSTSRRFCAQFTDHARTPSPTFQLLRLVRSPGIRALHKQTSSPRKRARAILRK